MKFKLLLVMLVSIALVAALACGTDEETAEPAPTTAAMAPTAAPAAPTTAPAAPTAAMAPTAAPAAPTAAPAAPTAAPEAMMPKVPPVFPVGDPASVIPADANLHDTQEIRVPNGHGGVAPWRDGGGQRIFSMWVYGTVYQIDKFGVLRPYIGISHTVNEDETVWTVKFREDAVFQDGTPITAASYKAYWEHGAKPENIVAWGRRKPDPRRHRWLGRAASGRRDRSPRAWTVIDDHTLQVDDGRFRWPTWPLNDGIAWHVRHLQARPGPCRRRLGEQRRSARGPTSLEVRTRTTRLYRRSTRVDLVGGQWNWPARRRRSSRSSFSVRTSLTTAGPGGRCSRTVSWTC